MVLTLLAVSFVGCGKKTDPSAPKEPPGFQYQDVYEITASEAERIFKDTYALVLDKFDKINQMGQQLLNNFNNSGNSSGAIDCVLSAMNNLEFIGLLSDYFSDNNNFFTTFVSGKCKFKVFKPNVDKCLGFEYINYTESEFIENFTILIYVDRGDIERLDAKRISISRRDLNMQVSGVDVDFLQDTISSFYGKSKMQGDVLDFADGIISDYKNYYWNVTATVMYDFANQKLDSSGYINQREPSTKNFFEMLKAAEFENLRTNLLSYNIGSTSNLVGDYVNAVMKNFVSFSESDARFIYENLSEGNDSV